MCAAAKREIEGAADFIEGGVKKHRLFFWLLEDRKVQRVRLRGASERGVELSDGLGALRDGVLGELTGEDETDGSLDLPRGDGLALVVAGKTAGLSGDALEDVLDEPGGKTTVSEGKRERREATQRGPGARGATKKRRRTS